MGKWIVIKTRMERRSDIERNQKLGITAEVQSMDNIVKLNVDKIVSYGPFYDEEGEPIQDRCEILLLSGDYMFPNMGYEELDNLIQPA